MGMVIDALSMIDTIRLLSHYCGTLHYDPSVWRIVVLIRAGGLTAGGHECVYHEGKQKRALMRFSQGLASSWRPHLYRDHYHVPCFELLPAVFVK
jgi:hypothetical protein